MIEAPPVAPAVKEITADPSLATADNDVGALAAIAAIDVVTADVPTILPVPFVALTTVRTNFPASASVNAYVADVAPDIATHVDKSVVEVHRCQVYVRLGVGVPVNVTVALLPKQTLVVLTLIEAIGNGNTVIVTVEETVGHQAEETV